MSTLEKSNNNIRSLIPNTYTRDPTYYYYDGNIVFLVEDVLSKLHKSILIPRMMAETCEFRQVKTSNNGSSQGKNDTNPIIVRGVNAEDFGHFLFAIMGTPDDPNYLALLNGAADYHNHTQDAFLRYLEISMLAYRFGMSKLEAWSRSQLALVLNSLIHFINSDWDKITLLRVVHYARTLSVALRSQMRTLVQLALSIPIPNNPLEFQPPLSPNINACIALYKDPELPRTQSTLFGYIFTIILSLGHSSSVWATQLTRDDRTTLYAAQLHLVSLHNIPDLDMSWFAQPPRTLPKTLPPVCTSCTKDVNHAWNESFARCGSIDSPIPSEDIYKLVHLPAYRQLFADSIRLSSELCEEECGRMILDSIDVMLCRIFSNMCRKYQHFAENA
ncbi:hypothetical protein BDV93DRAFT_525857 [Ceratobasidium sp. AG-I]|nr:hypothetical protein BDV93DRAFT_525857 [Ceratobasidium sp. AG-I]